MNAAFADMEKETEGTDNRGKEYEACRKKQCSCLAVVAALGDFR